MNDFLKQSEGVDMAALLEKEEEKIQKTLEYTRPLNQYPQTIDIVNFIKTRKGTQNVPTASLQVDGRVVQDAMEKYLGSENLSSGTIKQALNTMLHFEFERNSRKELEKLQGEKKHFTLGSFLHEAVLEVSKFKRVVAEPDFPRNTKDGVAELIEFWEETIRKQGEVFPSKDEVYEAEEAIEKAVEATTQDITKMNGMREYLANLIKISGLESVTAEHKMIIDCAYKNLKRYGNGIILDLLKHSKREVSVYTTDPETGLDVRVRPDAIQFSENIGVDAIVSVKTTSCETLGHFYYHSAKLNYETSEGMYQEVVSQATGRDFATTLMIMIQTVPPYGVALLRWNPEDIEVGKYKYRTAMQSIAEADFSKVVPSFDMYAEEGNMGIIELKQPDWNQKNIHPVDIND